MTLGDTQGVVVDRALRTLPTQRQEVELTLRGSQFVSQLKFPKLHDSWCPDMLYAVLVRVHHTSVR